MALIPFPGTDQFTGITISGLYDNNTESPLFAPTGGTVPTSGIAVGGSDPNGLYQAVHLDQSANSLTFPGIQFFPGTLWDSTTAGGTFQYNNGTITPLPVLSGAPAYLVELVQTTPFTAGAVTFEGTYDNINWVPIPVTQLLNPSTFAQLTNPYTFVPSTNAAFLILAQGFAAIRLELTTAITGAGTVTPYWSTLAYEPSITSTTSSVVSGNLSNNNAAPAGNNVGVLGFIAETAYNTVTYTTGNQVLAVTDLHGAINNDMQAVAGVQLGATAVTAFGTAPAAANVQGVNASLYAGTTGLTSTGAAGALDVNITGQPISVNATIVGQPIAVTISGQPISVTVTGTVTVAGNLSNNTAAPIADNVGVLGAIAVSGTFPAVTIQATTAGFQELLTVSQGGSLIQIPADEEYASHVGYYSVDTGNTLKTVTTGVVFPLVSIRSSSAAFQYLVRQVSGFTDGTQELISLLKNPTLTGATFAATAPTGSHVTVDTAATAVSASGTVIWSGFAASTPAFKDALLVALAAGAPGDIFTIACQKFGTGTSKAGGQIHWSEVAAAL